MSEPKYRGHRKGYAEIWIGESKDWPWVDRLRIRSATGEWKWFSSYNAEFTKCEPCWLKYYDGCGQNDIQAMKLYDEEFGRETIFLGYVWDAQ
jgi:hypothetical protein